ncbi:MAG: CubicO group peptidase (beta-lactamase class C family) [Maribacter sp.]|jgi:CubicO group peptidase (beta-lactamase class C family)
MKKVFKYLGIALLGLVVIALVLGLVYRKKLIRVNQVNHLFDADQITHNFMNMADVIPMNEIKKAGEPHVFAQGNAIELPKEFDYFGTQKNTEELLQYINNSGFVILHNDSIVYEHYRLGHTPETKHISWSVSKSFVSALFGIAVDEGHIKSLEETVTDYVPELKGSGYDGVRIKDILQMSSGVMFDEDYADFNSDINRMGRAIAFGTSMDDFAASLGPDRKPGTYNHYVSIDTHVLGMVLRKATGRAMHELLEEKIWSRLGMESNSYWIADDYGVSFVLGGLNATLRDYMRFGRLYLHNGNWNGEQIVPKEWVKSSITPDAPHLMPGENANSTNNLGYGYQWWLPSKPDGDFLAVGIHNQSIYVNQKKNLVIAINSSNAHFNDPGDDSKMMFIQLFQEIAKGLPDVGSEEVVEVLEEG